MELYLIRHTTPDVPAGTCYGRTDVPLQSDFLSEFSNVLEKLPALPQTLYSSPSSRCKKLAEFLTENRPIRLEYSNSLMELDFGIWEGKLWSAIPRSESEVWTKDFVKARPPGGESYLALNERVADYLDEILNTSENSPIGMVTHAGVIRAVLCRLLNIPLEQSFSFELNYGSVSKIDITKNGTEFFSKLIFWNR
ncbi:alpha-ribazole phosphatase [Leptospira yasudae]|uniref:Alpha-ribazole phosphatase n=1 Tax=Leptospira yasudae TaxID=2202201 RepID=A0A6N4QBA6_9LEPT|nr:alpha-ribazole phosphatase [Leptospira yasudae]TGL73673.1 alpha-ribazole phosphatase [Leptospira yasudae]TGL78812.1 alpha-ribazole phosphatase [Leptospira yasudae]TGL83452.1 alpha-ribazole phosphatase [Leptospira yasudae]